MSDSLRPHDLQHSSLPCPSLLPRVCSNSSSLSQWCHPTMSSSAAPFSFCLQSFPASQSFAMICLFTSGGQSIGASASASVLPMIIQAWFSLGLTGLISLQSKGLARVFSKLRGLKKEQSFYYDLLWMWERLKAGGESDDRGWDGSEASLTQWTWVWANSGRQWRTEKSGVLQLMGLQRVRHDCAAEQHRDRTKNKHTSPTRDN